MRLSLPGFVLCLSGLFLCVNVLASEMPQKLVGKADLEYWFFDIYHSRLYTHTGDYAQGQNGVLLELHYKRDVPENKLLEHTRKEWQHLGVDDEKITQWLELLRPLWGSVKKGETLSVYVNEKGFAEFRKNGHLGGVIHSPELSQKFLSIWLSPQTSRPGLRLALLGKSTAP